MEDVFKNIATSLKALMGEVIASEIRRALAEQTSVPAPLLVDTATAAAMLALPESWVASAARRGELPCVKLGHHVRFRLSDIEAFIKEKASCTQTNGAASGAAGHQRNPKSSTAGKDDGAAPLSARAAQH